MHGIVFWRHPAWNDKFELVNENISNLITWQDTRCDHDYLATLPRPDSHLKAYTGYGNNTLLWLLDNQPDAVQQFTHAATIQVNKTPLLWLFDNQPDAVQQFTHAATIQDFIVAMLCDLQAPVMSNQNAASWGYFNCKLNAWNAEILRAHHPQFPLHLLPDIQPSGTVVGKLTRDWLGITKDTPINVALGDLQCSVLATLQHNTDAIVNISTSAQIAFIDESFVPEDHYLDETNSLIARDEPNSGKHHKTENKRKVDVENIHIGNEATGSTGNPDPNPENVSSKLTETIEKTMDKESTRETSLDIDETVEKLSDERKELLHDSKNIGMRDTMTEETSKSTGESNVVESRVECQNMRESLLEHQYKGHTEEVSQESKGSCDEQNLVETPSQLNRIDNGQLRERLINDAVLLDPTTYYLERSRYGEEDIGYDEVDPILTTKETPISNQSTRLNNSQSTWKDIQSCCRCTTLTAAAQVSLSSQQDHIEHFPYFNGKYIAVGASMNGGNCLATFVCTLQAWFKEFGFNVPQNQIWSKLINATDDPQGYIRRNESELTILPTLLGDRHVIQESASMINITPGNLGVSKMFIALCKGIIDNLHSIMSRNRLHTARIDRIIGIGSCLTRNHILQHYVSQVYQLRLIIERD
ncbi:hypothetical protein WDU94_005704, partial [Cyamophila willieti]